MYRPRADSGNGHLEEAVRPGGTLIAENRAQFAMAAPFFEATPHDRPGFPRTGQAGASAGRPGAVALGEPAEELVEVVPLLTV